MQDHLITWNYGIKTQSDFKKFYPDQPFDITKIIYLLGDGYVIVHFGNLKVKLFNIKTLVGVEAGDSVLILEHNSQIYAYLITDENNYDNNLFISNSLQQKYVSAKL